MTTLTAWSSSPSGRRDSDSPSCSSGAERGVIPDMGAALFVMRRLLSTAAAIYRTTGIAHLAIAPERILVTPRG